MLEIFDEKTTRLWESIKMNKSINLTINHWKVLYWYDLDPQKCGNLNWIGHIFLIYWCNILDHKYKWWMFDCRQDINYNLVLAVTQTHLFLTASVLQEQAELAYSSRVMMRCSVLGLLLQAGSQRQLEPVCCSWVQWVLDPPSPLPFSSSFKYHLRIVLIAFWGTPNTFMSSLSRHRAEPPPRSVGTSQIRWHLPGSQTVLTWGQIRPSPKQ